MRPNSGRTAWLRLGYTWLRTLSSISSTRSRDKWIIEAEAAELWPRGRERPEADIDNQDHKGGGDITASFNAREMYDFVWYLKFTF